MPSAYPNAIDNLANPLGTDSLSSEVVPHASQHTNVNNAIEAIQVELGVNPAGASGSVAARINEINSLSGSAIQSNSRGIANGVATLDANSKLSQNVDAAKVNSGILNVARIPGISATKIVSGVFPRARIPAPLANDIPLLNVSSIPEEVALKDEVPLMRDLYNDILLKPTIYLAHRGGMDIYPENTMEAFSLAVAAGADGLETDIRATADNRLVLMHDATVNRTTNGNGSVADHTAASISRLNINMSPYGPEWAGSIIHPPSVEDFLREFGDKVFLSMECKDATIAALLLPILDRMISLKSNVVCVGPDEVEMAVLINAGYNVAVQGAESNGAALAAAGVVEVSQAQEDITQARVNDLQANGIRIRAYGVTRHYKRDNMLALGVDAMVINDPAYMLENALRTRDTFISQGWYPGHLSGGSKNGAEHNGHFEAPDAFGFNNSIGASGADSAVLQGWMSPIDGNPDNESYIIDFDIDITAAHTDASNITVALAKDDEAWGNHEVTTPGWNGYVCKERGGGAMEIYWFPGNGTEVLLASTAGTLPAYPVTLNNRVTVTPTTITWERTNGASVQASTVTHGPPGGYVHFGSGGMDVVFYNVVVTNT